mmetsp:Transcript_28154/g.84350  ORF Transcript_28154/g.84350 Transcript_28154/m.84350 type:complete len:1190 (-) Transcript_28154:385-3954(-)
MSPPPLLGDGNLCGATLLTLVSSGSALIAELLRLAQWIPAVFLDQEDRNHLGKPLIREDENLEKILFDFAYLREPEEFESLISANTGLLDRSAELLQTHGALLQRFYALLQSVVNYWNDVEVFLERLSSGYFIAHSIDNVLEDVDGKQLLCEAFFLYGTLLLLLEARVPGRARERLVIAWYRLHGASTFETFDQVCLIARCTGHVIGKPRPKNYPENFLGRFLTNATQGMARLIIQRLMNDDIYLQNASFPSPEHRSVRLASQASMLYVILFFDADILQRRDIMMREVVDKHFSDNWVIPLYMGHVIDLSVEWASYRAAAAALANVLTPAAANELMRTNSMLIARCLAELDNLLTEGQLTEQYMLNHLHGVLDCARRCNVALRWRLLHRCNTAAGQLRTIASELKDTDSLVTLLLKTSQLEYRIKKIVRHVLVGKTSRLDDLRRQAVRRMTELSEYCASGNALGLNSRDETLARWFAALAHQTASLDSELEQGTIVGRKIQTLVTALEEVEHFERIDTNLHIKSFLAATREDLLQMIRLSIIAPGIIETIEAISDLSYAWGILRDYIPIIHDRVSADPLTASLLRATFLKLASILDVPLVRISQCNSPDAPSVAAYYSGELVIFVRCVLDVIPVSVFGLLDDIVKLQTCALRPLPVRLEATYLANYAQLCARYKLARLTHRIAAFTKSVLAIENTFLGIICIDPRRILHDGLRKELVRQLAQTLHNTLCFPVPPNSRGSIEDGSSHSRLSLQVHNTLAALAVRVDGYRRSIEYIQDYIDVAGLKIWQEEFARVMRCNVERECNRFLRRRVSDLESRHQSIIIPIPKFPPIGTPADDGALTFVGRTLAALLRLTTPRHTSYSPEHVGWYADAAIFTQTSATGRQNATEICGVGTFQVIQGALGITGLLGLDRLLAFRVVHELTRFHDDHRRCAAAQNMLETHRDKIRLGCSRPLVVSTLYYARAVRAAEPYMPKVLHRVQTIGHAQLLRRSLTHALLRKSRIDADSLSHTLTVVDNALLGDILNQPTQLGISSLDCYGLTQASTLFETAGNSDVLTKVYVAGEPPENLPSLLFLFILTYVHKLHYNSCVASLVKRKACYPIDGFVIVVGVHTILKQTHSSSFRQLLVGLGKFVCITAQTYYARGLTQGKEPPLELLNTIWIIKALCHFDGVSDPAEFIPTPLLPKRRYSS